MKILKHVYGCLGHRGQFYLDWFRYKSGFLPRVSGKLKEGSFSWPYSKKACLIISADFELAWAWRYVKGVEDSLAFADKKAKQSRKNLPLLLALFDAYEIPVTWAAVGHLFLENCTKDNGIPHKNIPRPPYFENEFWHYTKGDWYDADPCSNVFKNPAWYGLDLIRSILSSKVKHEIACHSFSHIDCSDNYCTEELMDAELSECKRAASQVGLELKSFVFPGNCVGNLESLKRHGFKAYRFNKPPELDMPRKDKFGLWSIPGGICMEKPEGWPSRSWIQVLSKCITRALETRTLLHLWFHPSCSEENIKTIFPALLKYIHKYGENLWITTMDGLVKL